MCICVDIYVFVLMYTWMPEEGVRAPGAGVIGGYKQPGMSTGNHTPVL